MTGERICAAILACLLVVSALAVVHAEHRSRTLFMELQDANSERDALDAEWGMLRLEQGAWATHGRIERLAREELDMVLPRGDALVVLRGARKEDR